jgi:hypothetical protein
MAARSSAVHSLGDGLLLALAILFAAVAIVFFLGLVYGVVHLAPLLIVPQAVMALAFGLFDARLWQIWRARRAAPPPP